MQDDEIQQLKSEEKMVIEPDKSEDEGSSSSWIAGLVLIGIGVVFLLTNLTGFELDNWWALFILIPAFITLGNAIRAYRSEDGFGEEARGSLIGSLVLFFIASVFLFGWSWGTIWPVFLIIGGLGALLSVMGRDK
jgi:hypothetical protein